MFNRGNRISQAYIFLVGLVILSGEPIISVATHVGQRHSVLKADVTLLCFPLGM